MNTQSHAILTTVALRLGFGKRLAKLRYLNPVLVTGALLPELPLFIFVIYYSFIDVHTQSQLWNECYYYPEWQAAISIFHSFPIWGILAVTAFALKKPRVALFGLAGLVSSAEDFLLHSEDAHSHFWPLTDYRFASPVSYWDPDFHGAIASVGEIMIVLVASIWLWPKLESSWGKSLLILAMVTMLGSHGLWSLIFGFF